MYSIDRIAKYYIPTCGNSHQICTPPFIACSDRMKYSLSDDILRTHIFISFETVPSTPENIKFVFY